MGSRSLSLKTRFDDKWQAEPNSGCWLWTAALFKHGYGKISVGGGGGVDYAHRVSWRLHRGPIPAGMFVLHHCDNKACVNPAHLFLGTQADNLADMVSKARESHGEDRYNAKLSNADVVAIRAAYRSGRLQRELAVQYGLTQSHVSRIILRKEWRRVA